MRNVYIIQYGDITETYTNLKKLIDKYYLFKYWEVYRAINKDKFKYQEYTIIKSKLL